jgi:hypothetical protein
MTQILKPEPDDLEVITRVIQTQNAWIHVLEAIWRPMSVLTIPGHTLLTMTRGLFVDDKPSVRLRIAIGAGR